MIGLIVGLLPFIACMVMARRLARRGLTCFGRPDGREPRRSAAAYWRATASACSDFIRPFARSNGETTTGQRDSTRRRGRAAAATKPSQPPASAAAAGSSSTALDAEAARRKDTR